jgi:hypothetical protein
MASVNELLEILEERLESQESYSRIHVGASGGFNPDRTYDAIILSSVDGDLQIVDGAGNTVTLPQGTLNAGQPLQIAINEIKTGGSQTLSGTNVILLAN